MGNRRSIRLQDYDYRQNGAYFVTICTAKRELLFGDVVGDEVALNTFGCIVETCWEEIPKHFPHVETDAYVVMPNHVHGILMFVDAVGAQDLAPLPNGITRNNVSAGSLGAVMRSFKGAVTQKINHVRGARHPVWQRNYYEHIIRNEHSLYEKRRYILYNPAKWSEDSENPLTQR